MTGLAGKKALVTGGSRGVGRAIALEFARQGADVALVYRASDDLARAVAGEITAIGRKAVAIRADLKDASAAALAVERTIAELGGLDILAHSAGAQVEWVAVRDHDPGDWAGFVTNDLIGAFNIIQPAVRHMHGRKSGVVIAISSIAAQMCQARNSEGAAAKAGLEALIRVVAREEGRSGIRANAIAIGLTDTDQARQALEQWGPEATEKIIKAIPLGRMARPEEIAGMAAYLAGEQGAYITGKVIQVDGGQIICG
jgi:3-oxoacyl-[acyl-carrier protein] reductase